MRTYRIKKGAVNAKPNTTALRYTRNGIVWRGRFKLDYEHAMYFGEALVHPETGPVPPTHIKLAGLYWSGWNVWPRMREAWKKEVNYKGFVDGAWGYAAQRHSLAKWDSIKNSPRWRGYWLWRRIKAAIRQIPAWTHTNSVRLIAKWETRDGARGVALRSYVYDNGRGAATTGSIFANMELAWLPEDPDNPGWTVWGRVIMKPAKSMAVYANGDTDIFFPLPSPRPLFYGLTMAHANNGKRDENSKLINAPCDLMWEQKRRWL